MFIAEKGLPSEIIRDFCNDVINKYPRAVIQNIKLSRTNLTSITQVLANGHAALVDPRFHLFSPSLSLVDVLINRCLMKSRFLN